MITLVNTEEQTYSLAIHLKQYVQVTLSRKEIWERQFIVLVDPDTFEVLNVAYFNFNGDLLTLGNGFDYIIITSYRNFTI